MKISIVTSTFERAKELPKLYNSLAINYETFQDFEWIIMDDGSTDNTEALVNSWIELAPFKIDYHKNTNKGKQREINEAIKYITGDILLEIDSDDYLVDNALSIIHYDYESLTPNLYGIVYKRLLGNKKDKRYKKLNNKVMTLFDLQNRYVFEGDYFITFRSDVRKNYFYEVEDGESFVMEERLYYKLDLLFDGIIYKDNVLVKGEYMNEGYTKHLSDVLKSNPKGAYYYYEAAMSMIDKNTKRSRKKFINKQYRTFFDLICYNMKKDE